MSLFSVSRFVDQSQPDSWSNRARDNRFAVVRELLEAVAAATSHRPVRILDVGGEQAYWLRRGWDPSEHGFEVTLANYTEHPVDHPGFVAIAADASDLSRYNDNSFDLVFSNSTIEHLHTVLNQSRMASEVRRLAPAYYVQTPNFWFPIEPHHLLPAFHWLPKSARVRILHSTGWSAMGKRTKEFAAHVVDEVRILTRREVQAWFPDATVHVERVGPLTKSFVAVKMPGEASIR